MEHALTLAKAAAPQQVDRALALAATFHRFQAEDMDSILNTLNTERALTGTPREIEPSSSLAQGTHSWTGYGITPIAGVPVLPGANLADAHITGTQQKTCPSAHMTDEEVAA